MTSAFEARLTVMISGLGSKEKANQTNERVMEMMLAHHDDGREGDIVIGAEIREYNTETGVSDEFFDPDTVYIEDADPYKAPEMYTEFDCQAVIRVPGTGELIATGFGRVCDQDSEPWVLCAYPMDIWQRGWIVKPEKEAQDD